ncbi:MAG: hypothetical protein ACJA1C_001033 [Crocinitomicaceae bacterium]|jgi:hypothetical protein
MTETIVTTEELVKQFSDSILKPDFIKMASLFAEDGKFDIQDSKLETLEVGKDEFIEWIWVQRSFSSIRRIDYDQCMHCQIGAPVVLFNDGFFPRKVKDSSERSKTGLMLDNKEGLIHAIKFCFVFVKTENKCMFELGILEGCVKRIC